jgi:hypothetical protein
MRSEKNEEDERPAGTEATVAEEDEKREGDEEEKREDEEDERPAGTEAATAEENEDGGTNGPKGTAAEGEKDREIEGEAKTGGCVKGG